jgi:uncharacterized membrane-anchored protein
MSRLASASKGVGARPVALPAAAGSPSGLVVASGPIRKGRRTKELVKRIRPGDIVLIDHEDLDAIAAQALVDRKPAAVIDAKQPISGRYPNRGPSILLSARIPLFGLCDPNLFETLAEGSELLIRSDGAIEQSGERIQGAVEYWSRDRIGRAVELARGNLTGEIQRFADNTLSFVRTEAETLLEPISISDLTGLPRMEKRHVVIVVRGEGYRDDLASIRSYLSDMRPVVIGVDGGADALAECGIRPDIILGDMDSVSDKTLKCGAKLIVHGYSRSAAAPGLDRVRQLGLEAEVFRVPGTSEDAALLLAYEKGAELIVAVGTHSNLEDFLDKGRAGMASTFLTRLKVGRRLVDARGVSKLHQSRLGLGELAALILSVVFVLVTLLTKSPFGIVTARLVHLWWRLKLVNLQHLLWHLKLH